MLLYNLVTIESEHLMYFPVLYGHSLIVYVLKYAIIIYDRVIQLGIFIKLSVFAMYMFV